MERHRCMEHLNEKGKEPYYVLRTQYCLYPDIKDIKEMTHSLSINLSVEQTVSTNIKGPY